MPRSSVASGGAERGPPAAIALVGPTAAGKTEAGLIVAETLGTEIIGCDSRQVYRRLEIGTAKPTVEQRRRVTHHLVDVAEPDERFSAGRYRDLVVGLLPRFAAAARLPLFVGGTGLYLRAASDGLHPAPAGSPGLRRWLEAMSAEMPGGLQAMLAGVDPASAARIHPNDRLRLARALEVYLIGGEAPSRRRLAPRARPIAGRVLVFGIAVPPAELQARIRRRLAAMVAMGFADEVRLLLDEGWDASSPAFAAVGYPQFAAHVRGESSLADAVEATRRATWQYARRQMTWFRALPSVAWLDAAGGRGPDSLADEMLRRLRLEGVAA